MRPVDGETTANLVSAGEIHGLVVQARDVTLQLPAHQPPPPSQLPATPADFSGRADELAVLTDLLSGSGAVIVIHGMAGVGKTALAVRAGHLHANRFPDGQIFVDLHGYTEGLAPAKPTDVLQMLLQALGVPSNEVPVTLDARAALYRSLLASRRMLVVLDNAATESQVRPLLPGRDGCPAVITTRRQLPGIEGAVAVALDVMAEAEAGALFTQVAGADRVLDHFEGIREIVLLCGGLPLAIRIAAARLRLRRQWNLVDLVGRLRDTQRALGELRVGDLSVPAAFFLSYRDLPAEVQRLFRLLSLHPGPDVELATVAAAADQDAAQIESQLDALVDAHLLDEHFRHRYRFHDLLRGYARQLVMEVDSSAVHGATVERVLDHYVRLTTVSADLIRTRREPGVREVAPRSAEPSTYEQAIAWLETEHRNLVASIELGAEQGKGKHVVDLVCGMRRFFAIRGYTRQWIASHQTALEMARRVGSRRSEADLLNSLGIAYRRLGDAEQAVRLQREALAAYRDVEDLEGEIEVLTNLGIAHRRMCDFDGSVRFLQQALERYEPDKDLAGQAHTNDNLGTAFQRLGRYDEAMVQHKRGLDLARRIGDRSVEAMALTNLGIVHEKLGQHEEAQRHHQEALALARAIGDRHVEGHAESKLGVVHRKLGRYDVAVECQRSGLALLEETGSRGDQCEALNDLARTFRASGDLPQAREHHQHALTLARTINDRSEETRALRGLADVSDA